MNWWERFSGGVFCFDEREICFLNDQEVVLFHHDQDCCESVYVQDVVGDLNDLVGVPILEATVDDNVNHGSLGGEVEEWTFYKFRTIKGYVTIRW